MSQKWRFPLLEIRWRFHLWCSFSFCIWCLTIQHLRSERCSFGFLRSVEGETWNWNLYESVQPLECRPSGPPFENSIDIPPSTAIQNDLFSIVSISKAKYTMVFSTCFMCLGLVFLSLMLVIQLKNKRLGEGWAQPISKILTGVACAWLFLQGRSKPGVSSGLQNRKAHLVGHWRPAKLVWV